MMAKLLATLLKESSGIPAGGVIVFERKDVDCAGVTWYVFSYGVRWINLKLNEFEWGIK